MIDERPVLVTGASGNTGLPLVHQLLNAGVRVRGMVRSERSAAGLPAGVEPVLADFDDRDSLIRAVDGARATYLVTPSGEHVEEQQHRFVEVAAQTGVEQVVLLSQLAADADSPVRFLRYHAAIERDIRERGLGFTFLRPNLFFQGLLAFAPMIKESNAFFAPIGDARVSALDVRDIAAVAAASLTDERHLNQTYTLTGPDALTHTDIAAALSQATGRTITFSDVDPATFAGALQGVMPDWQIGGTTEDYAHYKAGEAAHVTTAIRDVTGADPIGIDQFAYDYAAAFAG